METELIINLIKFAPYYILKFIVAILMLLHIFFSLIVLKQTSLMVKVVEAKISSGIFLLSVMHFIASILVFVYSLLFI